MNTIHRNNMEPPCSRRTFLTIAGSSFLASSLASHLGADEVAGRRVPGDFERWRESLLQTSDALGKRTISALQWQERLDEIHREVPLSDLVRHLNLDGLRPELKAKVAGDRKEFFQRVPVGPMPDPNGGEDGEESLTLITKVAHVRRSGSIPPHGHSNMVSAFLCLSGEFDVRLFDRLDATENDMIVRESFAAETAGPGTWSSVSDYRDNVHWLTAKSDDCFLFTCKLLRLDADRPFRGRINIDVKGGTRLGSNTIRAPYITGAEAAAKY